MKERKAICRSNLENCQIPSKNSYDCLQCMKGYYLSPASIEGVYCVEKDIRYKLSILSCITLIILSLYLFLKVICDSFKNNEKVNKVKNYEKKDSDGGEKIYVQTEESERDLNCENGDELMSKIKLVPHYPQDIGSENPFMVYRGSLRRKDIKMARGRTMNV